MRELGYYWVKLEGIWTIGEWFEFSNTGRRMFFITGDDNGHYESDFEEIDERKIIRL